MHIVRPSKLLECNSELNCTKLLEEGEFQALLLARKLFMTRVGLTKEEALQFGEFLVPLSLETDKYLLNGTIIVPSGTEEEANKIIEERGYGEELVGTLTGVIGINLTANLN